MPTSNRSRPPACRSPRYVAPGDLHTVAGTDDLYTIEVEGVRLVDWLTALINDPEPPPDVHCVTCTE